MAWSTKQIKQHTQTAKLLGKIKDDTFQYMELQPKIDEYTVQQFVLEQFKKHNLKTALQPPIVAFGASAADPHYCPKTKSSRKLKKNTLIMLDIWACLKEKDAPYADMTWMAFYGRKVPKKVQEVFDVVIASRDAATQLLKSELRKRNIPTGAAMDACARKVIIKARYGKHFIHSLGHDIGTCSPHGRGPHLRKSNKKKLRKNIGYTNEPGIYLKGKFGVRSEIDFYITRDNKVVITTLMQKELTLFG